MMSAWIRDRKEFDREPPMILVEKLDGIVDSFPDYRVADKQRLLLAAIERRTKPAETTKLVLDEDYPVAWAESAKELRYLLNALSGRGLINLKERSEDAACEITPKGWDYLDQLGPKSAGSKQVFAAMSFNADMEKAWSEGIKPALESVGYRPYRVDMEQHVERIDAKIQAEIKASKFIVADVTGHRQGVYFEAGYAMGLGLQVVFCVREDQLGDVHFDTRQFNHVVWKDAADLRRLLAERVAGAINVAD